MTSFRRVRARWSRATLPLTALVGRGGLLGHYLLFAAVSLTVVALLAFFGTDGAWGSGLAATVLWNPTARSVFALMGWFPVRLYGALGDDSTNNTTAIDAAIAAAGALPNGVVFFSAGIYRYTNIAKTVDGVLLVGCGPGRSVLKTTRTHAADQQIAMSLIGHNLGLRSLEFREGNPITPRTGRLYFENGEMVRLGGTATPTFKERARVDDVLINGGYSGGLSVYYVDRAEAEDVRVINAFGDGMNFTNVREDVQVNRVTCQDCTDDLFIIKTDTTVPGGTLRANVSNLILRRGDAKGFATTGVQYLNATNVVVEDTYAGAVTIFEDPGFPDLQASHQVHLTNFHVRRAGKWFGADTSLYLNSSASSVPYGLHIENANGVKARNFTIYDAQGRGYSVDGTCTDLDLDIDVQGAGGFAGAVGDPDGSVFTKVSDFRVKHTSRNTVGGLLLGSCRRGVVEAPKVRSYKSGGAGSRRGIQIGKAQDVKVTSPHIVNDDGGDELVLVYNSPDNVVVERGIQRDGATLQWQGSVVWDPPNVLTGTSASTTVTVPGARAGDKLSVSSSINLLTGTDLAPVVSANDQVTVSLVNTSGGAYNYGSMTIDVKIPEKVYG